MHCHCHCSTRSLLHIISPSLYHCITASLHHCITVSLYHSLTASLHHCHTPSLLHRELSQCLTGAHASLCLRVTSRVQFPVFAIREITFLKRLRHPNIVRLLNIVSSKGCEELGLECLLSCDASIQYKWELSDSLLFVCVIVDSDIKTETLKDDPGVLSRKGASNTFLVFEYVEVRVKNSFIVWCSVTN